MTKELTPKRLPISRLGRLVLLRFSKGNSLDLFFLLFYKFIAFNHYFICVVLQLKRNVVTIDGYIDVTRISDYKLWPLSLWVWAYVLVIQNSSFTTRLALMIISIDTRLLLINKLLWLKAFNVCVTEDIHPAMCNWSFESGYINGGICFRKWNRLLDCEEFLRKNMRNEQLYLHATQHWKTCRSLWNKQVSFVYHKDQPKSTYSSFR